jgi:hypothetical protein
MIKLKTVSGGTRRRISHRMSSELKAAFTPSIPLLIFFFFFI